MNETISDFHMFGLPLQNILEQDRTFYRIGKDDGMFSLTFTISATIIWLILFEKQIQNIEVIGDFTALKNIILF